MVPEEIGISSFWMPLVIDDLYEAWKATRHTPESRKYLVDMYRHLVAAKKIRLISDLRSVYLLPPFAVKSYQLQDLRQMHRRMLASLGLSGLLAGEETVPEDLLGACTVDLVAYLDGADAEMAHIANGILYHLKIQSDGVFYWVGQLLNRQPRDRQGALKLGRTGSINLVWELLLGFAERREGLWGSEVKQYPENFRLAADCIRVLRKWYEAMRHKEKPVYLYHAILLMVRRDQIDWTSWPPAIDTPWSEVEALYDANLAGRALELDDFVFDIHTGSRDRNGHERFATTGAAVANEDRALLDERYRLVYNSLKGRLDAYKEGGMARAM